MTQLRVHRSFSEGGRSNVICSLLKKIPHSCRMICFPWIPAAAEMTNTGLLLLPHQSLLIHVRFTFEKRTLHRNTPYSPTDC